MYNFSFICVFPQLEENLFPQQSKLRMQPTMSANSVVGKKVFIPITNQVFIHASVIDPKRAQKLCVLANVQKRLLVNKI